MQLENGLSALTLQIDDATETAIRDAVGLSARELAALILIRNRTGCAVSWLHARLGLTQSGAVRLLDRLQELGLIQRTRLTGRRGVALAITARGEQSVVRGSAARAQAIDSQLGGLTPAERGAFAALVARALSGHPRSRDQGDEACRLCDWRACTPDCPMELAIASHGDDDGLG